MKCKCEDCDWCGMDHELLTYKHPFKENEIVYGCPKCKFCLEAFPIACDFLGCSGLATCGTPTKDGYLSTCSEHFPKSNYDNTKDK